jgi:hypothetical protein
MWTQTWRAIPHPCLCAALAAVRRHAAVCAEQRLLGRLVGVGLRAEQRHAQPAEHSAVIAGARRDRFATSSLADQRADRIDAGRFGHRLLARVGLAGSG